MSISYCICVLALLINKVSLHVVGVIGGSVVLPCTSREIEVKLSEISVHWRYNGSLTVYDIINGQCSVEDQEPVFKNRAEPVSKEYEKGNFSLKLKSLKHSDAGEYQCFITHSSELVKEQLLIKESTADNGVQEAETTLQTILISCVCVLLVICICIVIIVKKKSFFMRSVL